VAVSFTVEIGFDSAASTRLALVSWTDVTADVRAWSVNRGRQSELSTYSAGSATVVLDNRARAYDPSNTAGSYYGKILPRRRLRISLTAGAVSAAIFTGYVADWGLEWPEQGLDSTVTVSASDAFEVMSTRPQPGSAYAAEVLADAVINYWPLQDAASSPEWVDIVDPTGDLVPESVALYPAATSTLGLPIGQTTAQIGRYRNPFTTSLTTPEALEMWVSTSPDTTYLGEVIRAAASDDFLSVKPAMRSDGSGGYVEVRYSHGGKTDSAGSGVTLSFPTPRPDGVFHLVVTVDSTTITVYVNGEQVATDTLAVGSWSYGSVFRALVRTGDTAALSHVAAYSTAPDASRILAHYEAGLYAYGHPYGEQTGSRVERILTASGWPTADREITDPGATVVGQWLPAEASALAGCRECETAEQGAFFINGAGQATFRSRNQLLSLARCVTSQATFGDDAAETPVTNPLQVDGTNLDFVRNSVTVTYEGGAVTVSDETSVGDYGTLDDSVSAGLLDRANGWVARQLAAYRVRLRKTPVSRVPTIKAQLLDDLETHLAEVIPLELCDRVTVNRRPSGGTGTFSQQCHIQGIRWAWSPAQSYAWQAYLSPAVPSYSTADYLLIGDATYGKVGSTHTAVY